MNKPENLVSDDLSEPLIYPAEAFISREYAEAEPERLWSKVWQQAGRVEELKQVGDYITYNICHDSILIVRDTPTSLKAFHNVCPHRGRRLVSNNTGGGPKTIAQDTGAHSAKGSKLKLQAAIQDEKVRVTGAKRDDLQAAMALIRKDMSELPLSFDNFRD